MPRACPHCGTPFEPGQRGAVGEKCARCYQWARRHPGQPIPPRGGPRVAIVGPVRMSFGCPVLLREMMDELQVPEGERSKYIRQALEERLVRDMAERARAAGFSADEDTT